MGLRPEDLASAVSVPPASSRPMRGDLFVYTAGPITAKHGYTVEENVASAVKVYLDLLARGIPAFCPHLSGAFPSAFAVEWERWLDYDFTVIRRCTHVLLLPRWETSAGACRERAFAESIGVPVITDIAGLEDGEEVGVVDARSHS